MEIRKYQNESVLYYIRHNRRELPPGKYHGNESIDPSLSPSNYSLLSRGSSAEEVNRYRKEFEKDVFKYNRSNLVHAIEYVQQCPADCPEKEKSVFFKETLNYIRDTLLSGNEDLILDATVHVDERFYTPDGRMISKDHIHVLVIPAALAGEKHPEFQYKLCAKEFTNKTVIRTLTSGLQEHLDKTGVHATVCQKNTDGGKIIKLSVAQLKEITRRTGITIDHSLTVDELSDILAKVKEQEVRIDELERNLEKAHSYTKACTWGSDLEWGIFKGSDKSMEEKHW